jgi:hypothetical protein
MQIVKVTAKYSYIKLMNYTSIPNFRDDNEYRWPHKQIKGWLVDVDEQMTQEQYSARLFPAAT